METVQKPRSILGHARRCARVQESHRRGAMGATGEESFRAGGGAKNETNVRRLIKKESKRESGVCCEEQGFIVVVVYISLLEQLEASGVVSHIASFIYY